MVIDTVGQCHDTPGSRAIFRIGPREPDIRGRIGIEPCVQMTIGASEPIPYVGCGEFLRMNDELITQPDLLPALPAGDGIGGGMAEEGIEPVLMADCAPLRASFESTQPVMNATITRALNNMCLIRRGSRKLHTTSTRARLRELAFGRPSGECMPAYLTTKATVPLRRLRHRATANSYTTVLNVVIRDRFVEKDSEC